MSEAVGGKRKVWVKRGLVAAICTVVLGVVVFVVVPKWSNRGYDLPVDEFVDQMERIKAGMTKEEVLKTVTIYSRVREQGDSLSFFIDPKATHQSSLWFKTLEIAVVFDRNGKVARVWLGDG